MIQIFPADARHTVDHGWVRSSMSFPFAGQYDPEHTAFGVMRVCNDDYIAPGRGFGAHPHSDMEVVTIVLEGTIRHEDNLGNVATASFGELQRMTAGSGIIHAEYNASQTEALRSLQLWFEPSERGLEPSYETSKYDPANMANVLLPVVSKQASDGIAKIHQDMTIYLSRLDAGKSIEHLQAEGRRAFLMALEGRLEVNGERLERRDAARIRNVPALKLEAQIPSLFMLIDLP